MNTIKTANVLAVIGAMSLVVILLGSTPAPVSLSGSYALTNDVTKNLVYPAVTTRPIFSTAGYATPITFNDVASTNTAAWLWDDNPGGFVLQGALGCTGSIYSYGGSFWFLSTLTRFSEITGGGFSFTDTNHNRTVRIIDGGLVTTASSTIAGLILTNEQRMAITAWANGPSGALDFQYSGQSYTITAASAFTSFLNTRTDAVSKNFVDFDCTNSTAGDLTLWVTAAGYVSIDGSRSFVITNRSQREIRLTSSKSGVRGISQPWY